MPISKTFILSVCALLAAAAAHGEKANAQQIVAPRATSQPVPPKPTNAGGVPVEAWAVVRYSVLSDGKVDNVNVVRIAPPSAATSQIVATVEQWTFDPGMEAGEAIDWHNNESVVSFGSAATSEASEAFTEAYGAVAAMIDAHGATVAAAQSADQEQAQASADGSDQSLADAVAANDALLNEVATGAQEIGLALGQAALIRLAQLDPHGALELLRLATDPRVNALSGEELLVALQLRLQIETQLGRRADAIATYERIDAGVGPDETNPFASVAEELRNEHNDLEILQVLGRVEDHPWRIDTARRIFTIDNIDGTVQAIDAECDRRRLSLEYQPDVEWQLPDSLGECTLFVEAAEGTTFSFFELLPAE
jgi:hypothetical protein